MQIHYINHHSISQSITAVVRTTYFATELLKRMHRRTVHIVLMSLYTSLGCCPGQSNSSIPGQTLHIHNIQTSS